MWIGPVSLVTRNGRLKWFELVNVNDYINTLKGIGLNVVHTLQCFDAVGWAAGRASGL